MNFQRGAMPGFSSISETAEWSGFMSEPGDQPSYLCGVGIIDSTATDPTNTSNTGTLRGGLVVAKKTSDGNLYAYDADATDGTQNAVGVLPAALSILDFTGVAEDKQSLVLRKANLQAGAMVGLDLQARSQLVLQGFTFDSAWPDGAAGLERSAQIQETAGTAHAYTVSAADNGKLIVLSDGANAFGVALPALTAALVGLKVEFLQFGTGAVTFTADSANTIIYGDAGGALSSTIAWSTANKIMGGRGSFEVVYVGGTLYWAYTNKGTTATSA